MKIPFAVSTTPASSWETEECLLAMRWRNGVLQQLWGVTKWEQKGTFETPYVVKQRREWRDVPQVTE